jgi:hypothetical protein
LNVFTTRWMLQKKITVIPVVKDEGANGDRDYIQWDTVSLTSLLDIFVIFAYYAHILQNFFNSWRTASRIELDALSANYAGWRRVGATVLYGGMRQVKLEFAAIGTSNQYTFLRKIAVKSRQIKCCQKIKGKFLSFKAEHSLFT